MATLKKIKNKNCMYFLFEYKEQTYNFSNETDNCAMPKSLNLNKGIFIANLASLMKIVLVSTRISA